MSSPAPIDGPPSKRLEGRTAIVTGSASGIGRAIAVLFARHGANVIVNTDRRVGWAKETVRQVEQVGGSAHFVEGDVSRGPVVESLVRAAEHVYGRLHIYVNNAAVVYPNKVTETPEHEWDRTVDVILKAAYWGAHYAIPAMLRHGGGAFVNISSINAGNVSMPDWPAYVAAKGGLNALARQVALDYGAKGIRVNTVSPGSIANEQTEARLEQDPEGFRHKIDAYPAGRLGQPIDVANAALFLASDEAEFINGANLVVDGGLTCQSPEVPITPKTRASLGKPPLHYVERDASQRQG